MCASTNNQNFLEISRDMLNHNAKVVAEFVGVPVIAVLKCDGYGVSLQEAAQAWQKVGVSMFAVSTPDEALTLRQSGFQEDILLLTPVADEITLNYMLNNNIILTITGIEHARFCCLHADNLPLRVHVAIDTGMGRFGVRWTDTEELTAIYNLAGFQFEGVFSHFSSSFEREFSRTKEQLNRFLSVTAALTATGCNIGIRHIANSCAALRFPETRLDAVRIGSALVGRLSTQVPVPLESAAVYKAQVVDRKIFHPGDTTGYASICRIRKYTTAVVVAIGTNNGFGVKSAPDQLRLRDLAANLYHTLLDFRRKPTVSWQDRKLPLLGRIGTQYTLFDATGLDIRPGEYVTVQVPLLFPHTSRRFI